MINYNDEDYGFTSIFWPNYPKKVGKQAAKLKWIGLAKKKQLPEVSLILENLLKQVKYKAKCKEKGVFCAEFPDPERWIKYYRWEDEVPRDEKDTAVVKKTASDRAREAADNIKNRLTARNNNIDGFSVVATVDRVK